MVASLITQASLTSAFTAAGISLFARAAIGNAPSASTPAIIMLRHISHLG